MYRSKTGKEPHQLLVHLLRGRPTTGTEDDKSRGPPKAPLLDHRVRPIGLLAEITGYPDDIPFEGAPARLGPVMG